MTTSAYVTALVLMTTLAYSASANNYVAEVYFVVEPQVIKNYQKIGYSHSKAVATMKGDIELFIYQVNQFYKTMRPYGLNIEVRQKALNIMNEEMFDDCKLIHHTDLESDFALAVFKDWLNKTDAKSKIGYDIALVWTGFDIFNSGGSSVTGYATTNAVCTDSAVAIVEFDMTHNTAITTAHEIAHSLGSGHDRTYPCPLQDGYIMTPVASVRNEHRWEFSSCSCNDIKKNIASLEKANKNCLLKTTARASYFKLSSQAGRDIMNVEKICQRARKDKNSYLCRAPNLYNINPVKGDVICKMLMCSALDSSSCRTVMPTDGMMCDVNRRCKAGKCVAASFPTKPGLDQNCLFGDLKSKRIGRTNYTCELYINKRGASTCYNDDFSQMCCKTCGEAKIKNMPDCSYGDKTKQCDDYTSSQICSSGAENRNLCCFKCRNYVGKREAINETLVELELGPEDAYTNDFVLVEDHREPLFVNMD